MYRYRHGDPSKVGYVTSGFWAGLTIGRFVLTHFTARVGEKRFVFALTIGCLAFQLLVWFVPNIIGEAGE
jgi:fucose permease